MSIRSAVMTLVYYVYFRRVFQEIKVTVCRLFLRGDSYDRYSLNVLLKMSGIYVFSYSPLPCNYFSFTISTIFYTYLVLSKAIPNYPKLYSLFFSVDGYFMTLTPRVDDFEGEATLISPELSPTEVSS